MWRGLILSAVWKKKFEPGRSPKGAVPNPAALGSPSGGFRPAAAPKTRSQALRRDLEAAEPRVKQVLDEEPISGPAGGPFFSSFFSFLLFPFFLILSFSACFFCLFVCCFFLGFFFCLFSGLFLFLFFSFFFFFSLFLLFLFLFRGVREGGLRHTFRLGLPK